eukprot:m51a1_g4025 hypothetical protein (1123) ;mRNA; f:597392-606591
MDRQEEQQPIAGAQPSAATAATADAAADRSSGAARILAAGTVSYAFHRMVRHMWQTMLFVSVRVQLQHTPRLLERLILLLEVLQGLSFGLAPMGAGASGGAGRAVDALTHMRNITGSFNAAAFWFLTSTYLLMAVLIGMQVLVALRDGIVLELDPETKLELDSADQHSAKAKKYIAEFWKTLTMSKKLNDIIVVGELKQNTNSVVILEKYADFLETVKDDRELAAHGDTVKIANTLECKGLSERIQVSSVTRDQAPPVFSFEWQGPVSVKGYGSVDAWLLRDKATRRHASREDATETSLRPLVQGLDESLKIFMLEATNIIGEYRVHRHPSDAAVQKRLEKYKFMDQFFNKLSVIEAKLEALAHSSAPTALTVASRIRDLLVLSSPNVGPQQPLLADSQSDDDDTRRTRERSSSSTEASGALMTPEICLDTGCGETVFIPPPPIKAYSSMTLKTIAPVDTLVAAEAEREGRPHHRTHGKHRERSRSITGSSSSKGATVTAKAEPVGSALQYTLELNGPLQLVSAPVGTPDADGLRQVWCTNACDGKLRVLPGNGPESRQLLATIDLAVISERKVYKFNAANERDAVYWFLGLRAVIEDLKPRTKSPGVDDEPCPRETLVGEYQALSRLYDETSDQLDDVLASIKKNAAAGDELFKTYTQLLLDKRCLLTRRHDIACSMRKVLAVQASTRTDNGGPIHERSNSGVLLSTDKLPVPTWAAALELRDTHYASKETYIDQSRLSEPFRDWYTKAELMPLPNLRIHRQKHHSVTASFSGPPKDKPSSTYKESHRDLFACRIMSCYPISDETLRLVASGLITPSQDLPRLGDPICDHYALRLVGEMCVVAVADGCGWGEKPRNAASTAANTFVDALAHVCERIGSVSSASDYLVYAMDAASRAVIGDAVGAEKLSAIGTTTLLGGFVTRLGKRESLDEDRIFACIAVGDCKAFLFSSSLGVVEITEGNRVNLSDAADPGGRLGPQLSGGHPDLRNMKLYMKTCKKGDLILIVSDGVHDNLDPQTLGDTPKDWNIAVETWEEAAKSFPEKTTLAKSAYRNSQLRKIIAGLFKDGKVTLEDVCKEVVGHAYNLTKPMREFMELNPKKRQPTDHKLYPGKQDHTTCLCIRA